MASKQGSNTLYSWKYNDTKNRSPLWYMIALSIAIWLIIWWFFTRQYGMSIVIMLVVWFFYFLENNTEDDVEVIITELGVRIQTSFYDFSRIASFSTIFDGEEAVFLRLITKNRGIRILNLRIDNNVLSELRPILVQFIEENPKQELSFVEKLSHTLKL